MRTYRTFLPLQILIYLMLVSWARAQDWSTFRHDNARTGAQPMASILSNPGEVSRLAVRWAFPGAPPAAAAPFVNTYASADQQHFAYLAAFAANGEIWDAFYCNPCSGNKWRLQKINMNGSTAGPAAVAGPFVDTYASADQQHFAYLAANGEIWDAFYCNLCSGNKWRLQKINMNGSTAGPPAAAAPFVNTYASADQQHFAYLAANGETWDAFYCNPCSGNKWRLQKINMNGSTAGPPAVAGPFVDTYASADQQHFAYLAANGEIWDAFYCNPCSGNKWRLQKINMNGSTAGPPAVAGPFVNTYANADQQHFAYLAANGEIWDAFYCNPCSGNKWRLQKINMNGSTAGPPAVAGPFVNTYASADQQHFAYLTANGEIWDAFYCNPCSGNKWRLQKINMNGSTAGPPAVAGPFVDTYASADQQHFAYLAANGEIWDAFYCNPCSGQQVAVAGDQPNHLRNDTPGRQVLRCADRRRGDRLHREPERLFLRARRRLRGAQVAVPAHRTAGPARRGQ